MTSIHANLAVMAALSAKQLASSAVSRDMAMLSTGLRISQASDNAAYWSISTTMRSDVGALSTVRDSLGLSSSMIDVAYAGMTQTISTLGDVKARLLAAAENGQNRTAIQQDIAALADHAFGIAASASFAGSNWLSTDVPDIFEGGEEAASVKLTSSYSRSADGAVNIGTMSVDLRTTSLWNADGGGILQADPRSPGTVGGIRNPMANGAFSENNVSTGAPAGRNFLFSGPLAFGSSDSISFDLVVDGDNPNGASNGGIGGPFAAGTSARVTIDRSMVDAALPGNGGVVNDYNEMIRVLSTALAGTGAYASGVYQSVDGTPVQVPDLFRVSTRESSELDGSQVAISNIVGTAGTGGLSSFNAYGSRGSQITLAFTPFKVYEGVEVGFDFSVNGASSGSKTISRQLVDSVLGRDDGLVNTADEMAAILQSLVGQPGIVIESDGGSAVTLKTDPASDRLNGAKTGIGFRGISVNIEPIPAFGLRDIDVAAHPEMTEAYLAAVDAMISRATGGAAALGALKQRVSLQDGFISSLVDSMNRGIGQLVDADMDRLSVRLRAMQARDQLATQSLFIANDSQRQVLQLFQGIGR